MVYNKATYTGFIAESAVSAESTCVDPLQFCIEAAEMDHKLFEALITVDFTEAANSKGVINLSESEFNYMVEAAEEGIIAKLKALIAKFKDAMKNLFTKFVTFVSNLASNDKKIYEKYKDNVVASKIKDCDLKGEVVDVNNFNKVVDLSNANIDIANKIARDTTNVAGIKELVAVMEKNLKSIKQIVVINTDVELKNASIDDIVLSVKEGYKKQIDTATNTNKRVEAVIKGAQLEAEQAQRDASSKEDIDRANKAYEAISKCLSLAAATNSVYMSYLKRRIAVNRSTFMKLGSWVAKSGKKSVGETAYAEAYSMLIDITSDSYCESAWEEA
jgi:hypothetical protein